MISTEFITGLLGFLFTIMVLSYLIGDNPLFRLAVHVFVGLAAGYVISVVWRQVIVNQMILPMLQGSNTDRILLVTPFILSFFLLLRLFPRLQGISRPVVAIFVGIGAAVAIGGAVLGTLVPQTMATIDLFNFQELAASPFFIEKLIEAGMVALGTITALAFFQFGVSAKSRETGQRGWFMLVIAFVGQLFIAITLGVLFAGVFSSALAALVDRVQFILTFFSTLF